MFKNIVIAVLAACCIFLVLNQRMERVAWGEGEISPAEYGGLAALRDIFPPDGYRDRVLPLLRGAFQDGKISRDRLAALGTELKELGARTLSVLEKERAQDKFVRAWNDALSGAKEGAECFSESFCRQLGGAMRELGETWNDMTGKNAPQAPSSSTQDGVML